MTGRLNYRHEEGGTLVGKETFLKKLNERDPFLSQALNGEKIILRRYDPRRIAPIVPIKASRKCGGDVAEQ